MDKQPTAVKTEAAQGGSAAWDEARLEEALQHLKVLHIKARKLRETIPRMIDPLIQKQPSPDVMFNAFMESVGEAQTDIKEFTGLMRNGTSKEVFAHAQQSEEERPHGIKAWKHGDHPDWFRMDQK